MVLFASTPNHRTFFSLWLEDAIDACEQVAHILEGIVVNQT